MVTETRTDQPINPYDPPLADADGGNEAAVRQSVPKWNSRLWDALMAGVLVAWILGALLGSSIGLHVWSVVYPADKTPDMPYARTTGLFVGYVMYAVFQMRRSRLNRSTAALSLLMAAALGLGCSLADFGLAIGMHK